ncbi:Uu.00g056160.m01.CDS01 [Anthostomella pinea]|uniref:Uu.00g056160.m01.CDS01 n=1 Tax=Anthostomella pinea TaxID=933095 RepID=A0AAI8VRD4_9PEZI|nr:Uu.00g056160.m01.CDS01 [Anthostomella pinea]
MRASLLMAPAFTALVSAVPDTNGDSPIERGLPAKTLRDYEPPSRDLPRRRISSRDQAEDIYVHCMNDAVDQCKKAMQKRGDVDDLNECIENYREDDCKEGNEKFWGKAIKGIIAVL